MIRGTTPTHVFETDVDLSLAELIYVTYQQGQIVVEKTKEECDVTSNSVSVNLSQAETLLFRAGGFQARVQIRAKFPDGSALASNIIQVDISPILKEGEI